VLALIGNVLWFLLGGGLVACLLWLVAGVVLAVTVIGLPFSIAAFRIAGFAAFPFGRVLVDARQVGEERIVGTGLANFLWIILAGLWLAIAHVLAGVVCCLTLIGIPFGLAHFKLASICFAPLGKRTVSHASL
jgi:uncharacterized membrane protein YccF (DUF307 family)